MNRGMVDVRRFFESRLKKYGNSPRTLDWSAQGQQKRFEVLIGVGDVARREILDLGCGLGHFRRFLKENRIQATYYGLDLSPNLVKKARELNPNDSFDVLDIATQSLPRDADYVFASGVLNLKMDDNDAAMRKLLREAFAHCRAAVAVNMLSTWADWRDRKSHYYDPIKMTRFARKLTRRVVLRHDYLPHDFTLYLYREPAP